jgi:hypothetical protein
LYAGILAETAVLAILFQRGIVRLLPVFGIYVAWSTITDITFILLSQRSPNLYSKLFMVEMSLDALLQFGVLVELAWSVLRPFRALLPKGYLIAIAALILFAGGVIWPIAGMTVMPGLGPHSHRMIQLQQTFSALRIISFLTLAAFSRLLSIGWGNRELQVASGLGFYSLVSLGTAIIQSHLSSLAQYQMLDRVVSISYLCSLLYWAVSFLQKEAPRQEFSPRMRSILLTVSGAARANRMAIEEIAKTPKP